MNLFCGNYLRQKESHAGSQGGTPKGIPNQRSVSTQPFKPSNAKPLLNCASNDCSLGKTSGTSSFFASGSRFPSCDWMVVNTLTSTFTSHSIDWRSSLSTLLPMINWQPVEKKNIHVFYKLLQRIFMTFTIFVEHWVSCRGTFCS